MGKVLADRAAAEEEARKEKQKRSYAAARPTRLNVGWATQPTGANHERRVSLSALIARSRQASRDDLHIVNYLRLMRAGVIGQHGIRLQSGARGLDGKTLNVELNKRVEEAFWEWGHAETCTVSGKLDWKAIQDLAVTQCERDGAFLIQMVDADNEWGFALRTWDVTWLDFNYNENLQNGRRVIMSVEVDAYDKPVAYWMTVPSSEYEFAHRNYRQRTRTRIPAAEIIHGLQVFDDESQVHGVPGTAAALLPAKNAYSYSESVVMVSRASVNQFGVLKNTQPDGEGQFTGAEDAEGNPLHPFIDSAPLSITPLLPGWELQQFKPEHPTQNHEAFKQTLDMDIAVALGVPYFLLMGNWKAVNFSSSRGGLGEFRERLKGYQSFIATTLCRRVFNKWLTSALLSGKLKLKAHEVREVQNPTWQARGFEYIDPTKDIKADAEKLQNRLITPSEILAERGVDYPDFLERWQADRNLAEQYGIDIEAVYSAPKQLGPAPEVFEDDDETDDDDEPTPKQKKAAKSRGVGYTNGHFVEDSLR